MKYLSLSIFILLLSLLSACSNTSRQIVGNKRPPIDAEQVQVYLEKPIAYQQIAFLTASSKNAFRFSQDAMQDIAIQRLKEEAAELGANGVLLTTSEDEVTGAIGTGSGIQGRSIGLGLGLSFPVTNKLLRAVAIYVAPPSVGKQPEPNKTTPPDPN